MTKKNRKVKLLRTIYPHVNIQVFYQKDFQNLIFKHGLADREMSAAPPARSANERARFHPFCLPTSNGCCSPRSRSPPAFARWRVRSPSVIADGSEADRRAERFRLFPHGPGARNRHPGEDRLAGDLEFQQAAQRAGPGAHRERPRRADRRRRCAAGGGRRGYRVSRPGICCRRWPAAGPIRWLSCTLLDRTCRRIVQVPVEFRCFEKARGRCRDRRRRGCRGAPRRAGVGRPRSEGRAVHLRRLADLIDANVPRIAAVECADMGMLLASLEARVISRVPATSAPTPSSRRSTPSGAGRRTAPRTSSSACRRSPRWACPSSPSTSASSGPSTGGSGKCTSS